ncbi:MAG TPA: 4Fe-4S dicluster domain-containing protein [Desulfotomaculum sp.]|nr:MAG: 6-hydroxynicotinate reductase [Desulfotomaculum sp. BICA1-6]HBX24213.1 4Fe-4S dicluster domain-containing protein [Desulfotomaculum sp.]
MVNLDTEKCTGCGVCERVCPLEAIKVIEKKTFVEEHCAQCGACVRECKFNALSLPIENEEISVKCTSCPIQCQIKPGFTGACRRYVNIAGALIRNRTLITEPIAEKEIYAERIKRPLITGVGAGSTYPCCRPAPHIVQDTVDGVEVVTVVTEAPLSYSGVKVKIDTNFYIGEQGAKVRRDGRVVGMVETEEYGSKMISIGGVNILTGKSGIIAAKTVVEVCNGQRVKLKVEKGAELEIQVGKRPVINGQEDFKMRVGCGSATIGMFAQQLAEVVDEAIILDSHVVGLLSEHLAGEQVGLHWSGVIPNARKSTRGRYFGEHGDGWGGTNIINPRHAILEIDMKVAKPGIKILVTETTAQKAALFTLKENGAVKEIPLTYKVQQIVKLISSNCEEARVSAIYCAGTGGSARAGVTKSPVELTRAVHRGEANLTIGGAPAYVLPGGGINFMVDVEKIVPKAFTWVPTPATVAPVEYTVTKEKYREIGGHMEYIKDVSEIKGD